MSPGRRAALLTAALGCLLVSPLVWLNSLWSGPALIAAGIGHEGVWVGTGLLLLVAVALPPAFLAVGHRVSLGSRRARFGAITLALVAALIAFSPLYRLSLLSWLPAGRWLLAALAAITVTGLVVAGRAGDSTASDDGQRTRGLPVGLRRATIAAAAVFAAVAVAGAVDGARGTGIPGTPSHLFIPDFDGAGKVTGEPLDADRPAPFGGLLPGQGSNIHNDPGMTDAYFDRRVNDPASAEVRSYRAFGDCASLLFDAGGNLIAVCVGATRTTAHLLDSATLEPLASREISSRPLRPDVLTNFSGGGYAVLDRAGRLVIPSAEGTVDLFRTDFSPGRESIDQTGSIDVSSGLAGEETITSVLPESDRVWWYVGSAGTVGTIDPDSGRVRALHTSGADIENSFALAPGGGVFVVDSRALMRFRADPGGRPVKVWSEPYDAGDRRKPGQTSRASGTTPTVMDGGRLVAIADNADPRMNVQVFRAAPRVRGDRLLCSVPVFGERTGATENSLIAAGNSIFVENNYGYRLPDVIGGHSSEAGAARIDVDQGTGECETVWENDEVRIPSVVSKVSAADGLMLTYTKPALATGIDAWYFTGIDTGSGEVLWRRLAGTGPLANNHYAALYLGPAGNLYVGTLGGVIALTPGT